jgi:hypothetical protein
MKFAQEEWQCVGGGSCEAKVFSLEEKYSPVRPWRIDTLVEETLEGFKHHRALIVTFVLID